MAKLDTQGKTAVESADIMDSFKKHIMTKFSGCVVKDEHKDYVHFHVTNPGTPWAYLFSSMEAAKNEYPALTDYLVRKQLLNKCSCRLPMTNENYPMTNNTDLI